MPSHGRGSYRQAKANTKVAQAVVSQADQDIAQLTQAWQDERDRATEWENRLRELHDLMDDWDSFEHRYDHPGAWRTYVRNIIGARCELDGTV